MLIKTRKSYIESERGRVFYWMSRRDNDEDTTNIIFIHGMTEDHTLFDRQIKYFKDEFNVLAMDLPLHGESKHYKDFSYRNVAEDLKMIFDHENMKKVIIVGHSMGGFIAQEFYLHYPQYMEAFVGVDTAPLGYIYYSRFEKYITVNAWKVISICPYKLLIKLSARNVSEKAHTYNHFYNILSKLSQKEIVNIVKLALRELFIHKDASNLNIRVLLIAGENDISAYIKKYTIRWAERFSYPLKMIHHAAHNANDDNAAEFNKILEEFIKDQH